MARPSTTTIQQRDNESLIGVLVRATGLAERNGSPVAVDLKLAKSGAKLHVTPHGALELHRGNNLTDEGAITKHDYQRSAEAVELATELGRNIQLYSRLGSSEYIEVFPGSDAHATALFLRDLNNSELV